MSKAKDNNASCAIGPFIRLFDHTFTLNDIRTCDVELQIQGTDNFVLNGVSSMSQISRDPEDLIQQTLMKTINIQTVLFCSWVLYLHRLKIENKLGLAFTHKVGDVVRIHSPKLGTLYNTVMTSDKSNTVEFWNKCFDA